MSWINYAGYVSAGISKDSQPLNLTADDYSSINYGMHYTKPAVFMRYLEHYLSEEKINRVLADFISNVLGGFLTPLRMFNDLEK